jgi:hypothetical protein
MFPLENKTELKQSQVHPLHSLTPYAHKDPFSYYIDHGTSVSNKISLSSFAKTTVSRIKD